MSVGTAVRWTDQPVGVALLGLADARAAMAADIVEGADRAGAVAQHADRFACHLVGEEVARTWHLEGIADENPMAVKNPCQIGGEDLGCPVEIALQRSARPVFGDQAGKLRRHGGAGPYPPGVPSLRPCGQSHPAAPSPP